MKSRSIAIVGKGGVGKSSVTLLISRILAKNKKRHLLIDADPTMSHLAMSLNVIYEKTLEQIRLEVIKVAAKRNTEASKYIASNIDQIVSDSIIHKSDFSLLVMGQPQSSGCFCPINTLLRSVIDNISKQYEIVLIDCEAGLEQIHRKVVREVDDLIIITDNSMKSIATARAIIESSKKLTHFKKIGIIINKIRGSSQEKLIKKANELKVPLYGTIPDDSNVVEFEMRGESLLSLPNKSPAYIAVKNIVEKLFF
jgi:CO dehydrogenase maturation factor